jgi:hypothetical protein
MLYSSLIVAASAFAGFASAQNSTTNFNTPIPCCSVSAGAVNSTLRSSWCEANTNTCVDICGGQSQISSNGNECDDVSSLLLLPPPIVHSLTRNQTTLDFTCKCTNGTDAKTAMAAYEQSVPGQMCRFWYGKCIEASGDSSAQQFQCKQAAEATCGNLTVTDSGAVASASPSSLRSGSPTSGSPSAATGSPSSSPSSGAAAALAQYGAPIFAGGLLAVFGIAL